MMDVYFSGDQIPVFICELLLCHRLSGDVFGLLPLKLMFNDGCRSERECGMGEVGWKNRGVKDGSWEEL